MLALLNTLFVLTQSAYLHLDHDTIRVEVDGETQLRMPLLHLGGIACFGNVLLSPALLHRCAEDGRQLMWFDAIGRFRGRLEGPTTGNVLLRRAQHLALSDARRSAAIARYVIAGKIQNGRQVLLRGAREASDPADAEELRRAAAVLAAQIDKVGTATDANLDELRGSEGDAARAYFAVFRLLVRVDRPTFGIETRTRRPPLDPMNALLSFLYALLRNDCVAGIAGIGLDPQVGYLHSLRPGRPSLALDLMEELRPVLADRLALTLVNRQQIGPADFEAQEGGAVYLTERGRKEVVVAYQKRKQEEVEHRVLGRKVPLGLVPHLQARLLARYLRGELEHYIPYLHR